VKGFPNLQASLNNYVKKELLDGTNKIKVGEEYYEACKVYVKKSNLYIYIYIYCM
jgi:hypothetical protein